MLVLHPARMLALLIPAITLLALVLAPSGAAAADRDHAKLVSALRTQGSADGLVVFDHVPGLTGTAPSTRAVIDGFRSTWSRDKSRALRGVQLLEEYENLPVARVRFTSEEELRSVLADPRVKGIATDTRLESATSESLPLIRQPHVAAAGYRGKNTEVAVIDTGLDLAAFGCTSAGGTCPISETLATTDAGYSPQLHGTVVAEVVRATAPRTRIVSIDASGGEDGLYDSDVLDGIDEVLTRRRAGRPIRAVNLSLGAPDWFEESTCASTPEGNENPYTGAFAALRSVGTIPVAAAGNSRAGDRTGGITYPACTAGAISVGAVYDQRGSYTSGSCSDTSVVPDQVTCFSQTAPILSVLAPGALISVGSAEKVAGTSVAAPFVSGAAAVLWSARPSASTDRLQAAITRTGTPIPDPDTGVTHHRLQLCSALRQLLGTLVCATVERFPKLIYDAGPKQVNDITVDATPDFVTFSDSRPWPIDFSNGCMSIGDNQVRCLRDFDVRVNLGEGDDKATVRGDIEATMYGGQGNDTLTSSYGRDHLSGGAGNDVLDSGPERDRLLGGAGDDRLAGGWGTWWGITDARDTLSGGPGQDVADYSSHWRAVSITLDGAANDGTAAERDNVATEDVIGSRNDDLLYGSGLANTIRGGDGNDWIVGLAGVDELHGETGDDHLDARDGGVDRVIACGAGDDSVWADRTEAVFGCEAISRD